MASDDNSDGFSSTSDGVIADSSGDTTGDYSGWDWKMIMAAITGGAAYADSSSVTNPTEPQTIQDAADTLYYTQKVLEAVAQSITDQTNALTGENGPWQGPAAQALNGAMAGVAKQTQAMADVLSGGVTGDENVPQELADNAQHVRSAIAKINDINSWYAQQALKIKPSALMSNGLVAISQVPPLPTMMGNDMRQVLTTLAKHYELSKDSVAQPTSPNNPNNTGGGNNMPYYGPDGTNGPSIPPPYYGNVPNPYQYNENNPFGNNPYDTTGNNPYDTTGNNPYTIGNDPYGTGDNPDNSGVNVPKYKSNDPNLDLNSPDSLAVAPPPDFTSDAPGSGSGLPLHTNMESPAPFPDGTSVDGAPTGQLDPNMDAALNPVNTTALGEPISSFPNLGTLGSGSPEESPNSTKLAKITPYEGDTSVDGPGEIPSNMTDESVTPFSESGLSGLDPTGVDAPGVGGMPALSKFPGDTSLGSDGLPLRNLSTSGPGSEEGLGEDAALGAPAGEELGGSGMPMMPMGMGGGMGGMGAGNGQGGPSDASGLLTGDAAPWKSSSLGDGLGEVKGGADAGGPGLNLPGDNLSEDEQALGGTPVGEELGGSGMPMMPMGMGGGGAGGRSSEGTPSDASGLLHGDSAPWAGTHAESDGVTGGADAGGPGLSRAGEENAEGLPLMPVGAGNTGDDEEHEHSDASELLSGSAEPWGPTTDVFGGEGHVAPSHEALAADLFGAPAQDAPVNEQAPAASTAAEEAAGMLAWAPFLAAAAAEGAAAVPADTASGTGGGSAAAWDAPAWGSSSTEWVAAGGPAVPPVRAAAPQEETPAEVQEKAPAETRAQEHQRPRQEAMPHLSVRGVEAPGHQEGTPAVAGESEAVHQAEVPGRQEAVHAVAGEPEPEPVRRAEAPRRQEKAPAAAGEPEPAGNAGRTPVEEGRIPEALAGDDADTWDAADGSLLPLLGLRQGVADAAGLVATDLDRQDAAAAAAVAAGAFTIARSVTGEQGFAEPTRTAWRPKAASGPEPGGVELSCSFEDPEPTRRREPEPEPPAPAKGRGKGKGKEDDEEGRNSIADLLRLGEDVWG